MTCPFCEEVANNSERIIFETEFTVTIFSNPRLMGCHLLVIPKRHIQKPGELDEKERFDLFDQVINVQEKILQKLAPGCDISEHYRPFIPNSVYKVEHLHFHLRPRFLDDELYKKVQIYENDIFKSITDVEIEKYKKILS